MQNQSTYEFPKELKIGAGEVFNKTVDQILVHSVETSQRDKEDFTRWYDVLGFEDRTFMTTAVIGGRKNGANANVFPLGV